jgi:hypothetical protein
MKPIRRYSSIVASTGVPRTPRGRIARGPRAAVSTRFSTTSTGAAEHVRVHEGRHRRRRVEREAPGVVLDHPRDVRCAFVAHDRSVAHSNTSPGFARLRVRCPARRARGLRRSSRASDGKEERVRPVEHAREPVAGGSRHREPGRDRAYVGEIHPREAERIAGAHRFEEGDVLARVAGEEQIDVAHLPAHGFDRRGIHDGVDLVPASPRAIAEDHADLDHVDVGVRREELPGPEVDERVRGERAHVSEAELPQRVREDRILRAEDFEMPREPVERAEVEVIEVSVRDGDLVDPREPIDEDLALRAGDDRTVLERILEDRIHQHVGAIELDQERRVPEERDLHARAAARRKSSIWFRCCSQPGGFDRIQCSMRSGAAAAPPRPSVLHSPADDRHACEPPVKE